MEKSQFEPEAKPNTDYPQILRNRLKERYRDVTAQSQTPQNHSVEIGIPKRSLYFTFFTFPHQLVRRGYGGCIQILISDEHTFVLDLFSFELFFVCLFFLGFFDRLRGFVAVVWSFFFNYLNLVKPILILTKA